MSGQIPGPPHEPGSPHDPLLLQIRGAVAEYERTLITERMRRGRLAKLRAGILLPWTHAPYGYCPHPDRPRDPRGLTLDPAAAAAVSEIFARYLEPGVSLLQVARLLRDRQIPSPTGKPFWGLATVRGILTNPGVHRPGLRGPDPLSSGPYPALGHSSDRPAP